MGACRPVLKRGKSAVWNGDVVGPLRVRSSVRPGLQPQVAASPAPISLQLAAGRSRLVLFPHPLGSRLSFLLQSCLSFLSYGQLRSAVTRSRRLTFSPPQALAARQQARRLRWARPPPPAQLRATRERMRREVRMQAVLRWVQGFQSEPTSIWSAKCTWDPQNQHRVPQDMGCLETELVSAGWREPWPWHPR